MLKVNCTLEVMFLLFDIGGTKMRFCLSDGNNLGDVITIPTEKDFEKALAEIERTVSKLTSGQSLQATYGGVRALDSTKTTLKPQPHFPLWEGLPLKQRMEEMLNTKVVLENDASLAGLGEAIYGVGKGYKAVAYLSVSTGVGGVKILDGKIDPSSEQSEIGQQIIEGQTLESLISGEGIRRRIGKEASRINDPKVWEEIAKYLVAGLKIVATNWSPEIIILGGAVIKSIPMSSVYSAFSKPSPKLTLSKFGDLSGLYGALALLNQNLS